MANAVPPQSFGPNKDYLAFSGLINQVIQPVFYTGGSRALTPSDVLSGFISHTLAAAATDTLPSAAALVPLIQGAQVGSAIEFAIRNTGAFALTINAGAGGSFAPTDTALNTVNAQIRDLLLVVTALPDQYGNGAAYTIYSLGASGAAGGL